MSLKAYRNREISAYDYLKAKLEETSLDKVRKNEGVIAIVGNTNDVMNLCYIVGTRSGPNTFSGVVKNPNSKVFNEGMKPFFKDQEVEVFKYDKISASDDLKELMKELTGHTLAKLVTLLDKD